MQKLIRRLITLVLGVTVAWLMTQVWFDFRSPAPPAGQTTISTPRGSNLQPIDALATAESDSLALPNVTENDTAPSTTAGPIVDEQIARLEQQVKDLGTQLGQSESLVARLQTEQLEEFLEVEWRSDGTLEFLQNFGYIKVPLLRKVGYFEVKVQLNGQNAYFLLDTGAAQSLIGADQAEKFEIAIDTLAQSREYVGLGGKSVTSEVAKLDSFMIESVAFDTLSLSLVDLSYINQILVKAGQYPVHGLLGDDFLEAQQAIIDLKNETLYLRSN